MEESLQVRIEADIKNFQQGMNQVEKNLQRAEGIFQRSSKSAFQLENAISQLSKEFKTGAISNNEYSARLAHLNAELTQQRSNVSASAKEIDRLNKLMDASRLQKVAVANNQVAGSFNGLAKNVRGSNTVALEFNRIIQDAPFGIIGIGNNLQQLSANFSNLSKNAGGAGPAIKAAFSALVTGPNLALLAISALTAGFTAYQMGAFDFLKTNKEAKKSLEDLQKELDEYRQSLESTQQASIIGSQNAQREISLLDALAQQAENTALSNEKRTQAVNELQRLYPEYFKNLTEEQVLNGEVGKELSTLRNNLIETARAYATIDKVRENSIALLDLESRALTRAGEILDKVNKLRELQAEAEDLRANPSIALAGQALESIEQSRTRINSELNSLLKEQSKDSQDINKINADNLALQERINVALENGGNLVDNLKGSVSGVRNELQEVDISNLFTIDQENLSKRINDALTQISSDISNQGTIKNVPIKVDLKPEQLDPETAAQNDNFNRLWDERQETITRFASQMESTLARSFEGAIMNGDNFFDAVEQGFKRMLARLAAQIAASAAIKLLATVIGGPAGAAIAGGASSGIGSLLFGGGAGLRVGATPSVGMPTAGTTTAGYKVDVNVHGVLRGNDIHVAQQRNNRDFNRWY